MWLLPHLNTIDQIIAQNPPCDLGHAPINDVLRNGSCHLTEILEMAERFSKSTRDRCTDAGTPPRFK